MSIRRVGVLLGKEIWHGSKSFFFFQSVLTPLLMTIVINLVFGTIFTRKPKLGIADIGNSAITYQAAKDSTITLKKYGNEHEMKAAVETGLVDVGILLQKDFDSKLKGGKSIQLSTYIWGESHLIDRGVLGATIIRWIREVSGIHSPVEIVSITIGEREAVSWKDRVMPLIVLLAIVMGGLIIPGTSIADEKEKETIKAISITPVSIGEIFLAKGLMGFIVSLIMGIMILLLNRSFGNHVVLLLVLLALGAAMSSTFGTLIGSLIEDVESYFSIVKPLIMLIYAPGILLLFPKVPAWISKLFPTHYILNPVVTITQRGGALPDVVLEACIGIGITLLVIFFISLIARNPIKQTA